MKQPVIAIIGNPNCGKSTLFNCLTGAKQKIGNWPGVTVDKKSGHMQIGQQQYSVIDLPGIYSLSVATNSAMDEQIACEFMLSKNVDRIINIVDASNLKRNLYLTVQLLEMQMPCIVVLNMMDVAKQRNIHIDIEKLEAELGCLVVPMTLSKKQGLQKLKSLIAKPLEKSAKNIFSELSTNKPIEQAIQSIEHLLENTINQRFYAMRLLERDVCIGSQFTTPEIQQKVTEAIGILEKHYGEDSDIIFADARYQIVSKICAATVTKQNSHKNTITEKIDKVVMHKWLGIPIFLGIMYLMFELSMNIGTLLQPLFDISSTTIFIDGAGYLGQTLGLPLWITAIFARGIGLGINTVVNFIPQIGLMFLFLSLLEDSGYMARAAFVMDRFMQFAGLPGKSFVPLIVGFGCNVPSIMATRTLDSRRDRILTCMMAPFMSCGARLAIFAVFASAFFPHHAGAMIFLLYITGILAAVGTGILLKKTILLGESSPFILELPVYHVPLLKNISLLTWNRLKRFIFRAGKVIVPICLLVGSLNAITPGGKVFPYGSQDSLLSNFGRAVTPVLQPMGIEQNNWPATVGLITGTLAKEVVVGTLNTLYSKPENKDFANFNLWAGLQSAVTTTLSGFSSVFSVERINPFTANEANHEMSKTAMGNMEQAFPNQWAAFAYLLFVLLYIPCVSTMSVLAREIGKSWAWGSILWSFNVAYALSVIFYQAITFSEHPLYSSSWIAALISVQILIFGALHFWFSPKETQHVVNRT